MAKDKNASPKGLLDDDEWESRESREHDRDEYDRDRERERE